MNHIGVKCGKYGNSLSCTGCLEKYGIDSCYGEYCGLVANNDSKVACEPKGKSTSYFYLKFTRNIFITKVLIRYTR